MILALQEDQVLYVYATPEAAAREVEGLDAEETFRAIFDDQAQPYAIEWIRSNKLTRFLGLLFAAGNGQYRLVPRGAPDPGGLFGAIRAAASVDPRDQEQFVRELERRLANRLT